MSWANTYGQDRQPTPEQIAEYVQSPLWAAINQFLQEGYQVAPEYGYSGCSGQPGWNVKYKKAGRALCTLYPMDGFFIALVTIGSKELTQAELSMPMCTPYTRELFENTPCSAGSRWLMIRVTEPGILEDVKMLIQIRRKTKSG